MGARLGGGRDGGVSVGLTKFDRVRIAVVGVGGFGAQHADAFASQPGAHLVAVADKDTDRAAQVATRCGADRWFDDAEALLDAGGFDALVVATSGGSHVAVATSALSAGLPVLLEKPVALTVSEAEELLAAESRSTGFVVPAHISRFAAAYANLRSCVTRGELGTVLALSAERHRDRSHLENYGDVHPVLMTMVHDIDLALWITGCHPVRVVARERRLATSRPPSFVTAQVETREGQLWSLSQSWLVPDDAFLPDRLRVFGDAGIGQVEIGASLGLLREAPGLAPPYPEALYAALREEVAHFCGCVRSGSRSTVVSLSDAVEGIRVAEAVILSAASGGIPVEVR